MEGNFFPTQLSACLTITWTHWAMTAALQEPIDFLENQRLSQTAASLSAQPSFLSAFFFFFLTDSQTTTGMLLLVNN